MFFFQNNRFICLAIMFLMLTTTVQAKQLTAKEIMLKNEATRKSLNEVADLKMVLTNNSGKQRTRSVIWIADDTDPINRKSLVRFTAPRDVKGTGLLTMEKTDIDDDRWLYLPALRKVRRISASDKTDSFMGTDFSYEDFEILDGIEGTKKREYNFLRQELKNGAECYVIEAVTTDPNELELSGFSKRLVWIRIDNLVNTHEDYFDKDGVLYKTLDSTDIRRIQGDEDQFRAHKLEMKTLKTGHVTTLYFDNFLVNQTLAKNTFSRRYLQRGR